jgi:hypothetical protein
MGRLDRSMSRALRALCAVVTLALLLGGVWPALHHHDGAAAEARCSACVLAHATSTLPPDAPRVVRPSNVTPALAGPGLGTVHSPPSSEAAPRAPPLS